MPMMGRDGLTGLDESFDRVPTHRLQQAEAPLLANAAVALEVIRELTDERLDRRVTDADREAVGPFNPDLHAAGQIVEQCPVGHLRVHLTSFEATTIGRWRVADRRRSRPEQPSEPATSSAARLPWLPRAPLTIAELRGRADARVPHAAGPV